MFCFFTSYYYTLILTSYHLLYTVFGNPCVLSCRLPISTSFEAPNLFAL